MIGYNEGILWAARSQKIKTSLEKTERALQASKDPVRDSRYFVLATPVQDLPKRHETREGELREIVREKIDFGGANSRVFGRLGVDLIHVTEDGRAVVHAQRDRFAQLLHKASLLEELGLREQLRWATIDRFDPIPIELRIDAEWLRGIRPSDLADVVIELQPLLVRVEVENLLRAISDLFAGHKGDILTGTGTDFSGRNWFRGKASRESIRRIAREFFSVQALHPPLYSLAAGKAHRRTAAIAKEAL